MESVYLNGGMIGVTLDFADTDRYVLSTSTTYQAPTYIGGASGAASNGGAITLDLSSFSMQESDLIITAVSAADSGAENLLLPSEATIIGTYLFGNDTEDISMEVGYYIVGATPPTSITSTASGDTDNSTTHIVQIFRGVDLTAFAASISDTSGYTTNVVSNTATPSFAAISTSLDNSLVVAIAASSVDTANLPYSTPSDLSNFTTIGGNDTYDAVGGMGWALVETGGSSFTASSWTPPDDDSAKASVAMQLVLPSLEVEVPVYGNYKNSGIWNLQAVLESLEV